MGSWTFVSDVAIAGCVCPWLIANGATALAPVSLCWKCSRLSVSVGYSCFATKAHNIEVVVNQPCWSVVPRKPFACSTGMFLHHVVRLATYNVNQSPESR